MDELSMLKARVIVLEKQMETVNRLLGELNGLVRDLFTLVRTLLPEESQQ